MWVQDENEHKFHNGNLYIETFNTRKQNEECKDYITGENLKYQFLYIFLNILFTQIVQIIPRCLLAGVRQAWLLLPIDRLKEDGNCWWRERLTG